MLLFVVSKLDFQKKKLLNLLGPISLSVKGGYEIRWSKRCFSAQRFMIYIIISLYKEKFRDGILFKIILYYF